MWSFFFIFFRYSPRIFFEWRNFLLRIFGAKIGSHVHIYPSATIYIPWNLKIGDESSIGEWTLIYNLGKIDIGSQTTISHRAHLCAGTRNYSNPKLPLMHLWKLVIRLGFVQRFYWSKCKYRKWCNSWRWLGSYKKY